MSTVIPKMAAGGNIDVATDAEGSNWATFASQGCRQLTIANNTGVALEFRTGGQGDAMPIFNATYYTIYGLANCADVSVRRIDQADTPVNVQARWEV